MSRRIALSTLLVLTLAATLWAQPVVYSPGGATRSLDMDRWQIDCIIDPAVRYMMAQATSRAASDIDFLIVGINMEDSVCTELPYELVVTGIPGAPPPGIEAYTPDACWWEGYPIHWYDEELSGIVEASPLNPIPGVGAWRVFTVPLYPSSLPASAVPNIEFYYIFESNDAYRKIYESVNGLMCGTVSSEPATFGAAQVDTLLYFEVPWNAEPPDSHKMHFPQHPDTAGIDIDFTFPYTVADDWTCTQGGAVDRIRFWFSSRFDWFNPYGDLTDQIMNIHLRIYSNEPDNDYHGPDFSRPDSLLWELVLPPDGPEVTFSEYAMGWQGYYYPWIEEYFLDDHMHIFECRIEGLQEPFLQDAGKVYWLAISIETFGYDLGWKTSDWTLYPADYRGRRYMDDAVWGDMFIQEWTNLTYPAGPDSGESLDLSFIVGTMPQVCCDGRWGPTEWCGQDCMAAVGSTDMTHDCLVDLMDYFLFACEYQQSGPCLSGDFDANNTVDLMDLSTFVTYYGTPVSPCTPADQVLLGGPAGKLHLSFDTDPDSLVTYLINPPTGLMTLYVLARDLPSPIGATEFGILTNTNPDHIFSFDPVSPFTLDIGTGLTDIALAAGAEQSGPVVMGALQFFYAGEARLSFEIINNTNHGGKRWISPSSNVYHDWAMASPAFIYTDPTAAVEPTDLPAVFRLYASAPNPFDASATIRYDLAAPERVNLTVYDVEGRVVRALVDLPLQGAGRHSATWDGRDRAGRPVAPGIYFSRLETDTFSATQRMTLLR